MAENPYDLAKGGRGKGRGGRPPPPRPALATPLTESEQLEKLTGYLAVPADFWPFVRYSTHVRYITTDGDFRSGGFVLKNPFDTKVQGRGAEKRFLKLQNGFNRSACSDVAYLYVKGDGADLSPKPDLETAVKGLNQNIQKLAEFCKKLEKRIAALEERGR
jgi:hypothetical protein